MTDGSEPSAYEFGGHRLEPRHRALTRLPDTPVDLNDKAFDTLVYLVENAGRLVTKGELLRALWPTTVVEENSLYAAVSALRRALKDDSASPALIATVAGRGYQFIAGVRKLDAPPPEAAPPPAPDRPAPAPPRPRPVRTRWWAAAAALPIAAGIVAIAMRYLPPDKPAPPQRITTLAVLPFKPLTTDDRNESLELGMAETLIAGLNDARLSVTPLSSVRRYAGVEQDGLAAGRELGVQAVLEGHMQRAGDKLRVSARLLNVADGRQLWAQRYDERFTDIFSVQDAIAERVQLALTAELAGRPPQALHRYTEDAEAYQQFANGRYHALRLALPEALAHFEQAVALDPGFALAYVGIAQTRSMLGVFGAVAPRETFPQALQAVEKALELAPELGEAYASLAHIKVQYEHDWPGAMRAFDRAIALNPGYSHSHEWLGLHLATRGRFDEGTAELRTAQALEPAQPVFSALIGMVLVYQRRYAEAIEQLESTLEMNPDFPTTNAYLALAYLRRGDYDKALAHLERTRTLAPGSGAYRAQVYAFSGRRDEAVGELERLLASAKQRYVPAYDIATIYAALGNADETFRWLERAFEERSQLIHWLPWDAVFDGIRADARYAPLFARLPAALEPPGEGP
jgi:TolB-like protein/DNA-binding winged helix-turn-helix (wHTH) protein/Flp pilus assembly protein TadD